MKAFAFVGSTRKNSNTLKVTRLLLDTLEKRYNTDVDYEIYTPEDLNLNFCQGCETCFNRGYCPMDSLDHFDIIKEKMLAADVIILGTPVYGAAVSASMKLFIDRLSYWLHLLSFAGKIGVSIITASSNSVVETNIYLKKIMESLGLCMACSVLCTVDVPPMLESDTFKNQTIPQYADCILDYVTGKRKIISTDYQEQYFAHMRLGYDVPGNTEYAEAKYWKEKGYINYNSYSELLEGIKENS